jgi:hypothetical protein
MTFTSATRPTVRASFLPRGGTLVLDNAEGTTIEVDRGCLWLTLEQDPRDVILVAGMHFEIDRSGRTVIVAEQDTCMRVRAQVGKLARAAARVANFVGPAYTRWAERNLRRALHYL